MIGRVFAAQISLVRKNSRRVPKYDLSAAEMYGEVIPVVEGEIKDSGELKAIIRQRLQDFNGDTDFILAIGDPAVMMAIGTYLGQKLDVQKYRVLKWDRHVEKYFPSIIQKY